MAKLISYMLVMLMYSCGGSQPSGTGFSSVPKPKKGEQVATFGGGCFWSMSKAISELKGVNNVISGYAGGTKINPSYEDVCTDQTGHAEVVQVYYDPEIIDYSTLAEGFFSAHDPTTLNRQGPDEGKDYRSIAFYRTAQEKQVLEETIAKVNTSRHYRGKVVTEVKPFTVFYPAEQYH